MRKFCLLVLMLSSVAFAVDPIAVQHLSFEDNFGIAEHVDDNLGVVGDIQFKTDAVIGKSAEFTNPLGEGTGGTGDSLTLNHNLGESGTISAFLKVDQYYDYQTIFDVSSHWFNWETSIYGDGTFLFTTSGWPITSTDINALTDNWFHYVATWDKAPGAAGARIYMYINGQEVSTALNNSWFEPGNLFSIGGIHPWNSRYNGMIDEFYIFDRVLTADEVAGLNATLTSGTIAYDPSPFVGSVINEDIVELTWQAPADVASPTYDVYLSTDPNMLDATPVASGLAETSYITTAALESRVTYYWRVDVVDGANTYKGIEWSFDTILGENRPVAKSYISFEDSAFGGAEYIDDQDGIVGDIQITEGGLVGKYGNFINPNTATDGDSLYVAHPGDSGSISMWAKFADAEALAVYPVFWDSSVTGNDWKAWGFTGNTITVRLASSAWQANQGTVADLTAWNHVVWTWEYMGDGATANTALYLNGVLANERMQNFDAHADVLRIGGGGAWYPKFDGGMDEVYIFDSALSADQVAEIVNETNYKAYDPKPLVGQDKVAMDAVLSWKAPAGVTSPTYDVYVSTDPYLPPLSKVASGITETSFACTNLTEGQTNYWRVDVIDGETVYKGLVWAFTPVYLDSDINTDSDVDLEDVAILAANWNQNTITTPELKLVVDDFESYLPAPADPNIAGTWIRRADFATDATGVTTVDIVDANGGQAMVLAYDFSALDGTGWAVADWKVLFDTPQDLTGYSKFVFKVNCLAGNSKEDHLSIKFLKGGSTVADYVIYPSLYQLNEDTGATTNMAPGWQTITVDLSDRTGLTDIYGLVFDVSTWPEGSGVPYNGERGSGTIYFDDISFVTDQICSGPQEADINGDCKADLADLQIMVSEWLAY